MRRAQNVEDFGIEPRDRAPAERGDHVIECALPAQRAGRRSHPPARGRARRGSRVRTRASGAGSRSAASVDTARRACVGRHPCGSNHRPVRPWLPGRNVPAGEESRADIARRPSGCSCKKASTRPSPATTSKRSESGAHDRAGPIGTDGRSSPRCDESSTASAERRAETSGHGCRPRTRL